MELLDKRSICIILLFLISLSASSKQNEVKPKFIDGRKLTIQGRPEMVNEKYFRRIDSLYYTGLPERVKQLSTQSAGINIVFKTNSTKIDVRWKVHKYISKSNMTPVAINGLDLYGWNGHSWQFVASAMPESESNTATFIKNLDGKMRHYKIYLPLYSELIDIEIGIDNQADIEPADAEYLPVKKVAIYGSSITQGASASRPGMAYPSIMARKLNIETFNLGFSGSGKMEIELADIMAKIPADLYILDCVPNSSPALINERAIPFIRKLRLLRPNVPILMVESIFREYGNWDKEIGTHVNEQNNSFKKAYKQLDSENFKQLYYIPSDKLIGSDHEATIDGVHLTDLGQQRIADRISKFIVKILR